MTIRIRGIHRRTMIAACSKQLGMRTGLRTHLRQTHWARGRLQRVVEAQPAATLHWGHCRHIHVLEQAHACVSMCVMLCSVWFGHKVPICSLNSFAPGCHSSSIKRPTQQLGDPRASAVTPDLKRQTKSLHQILLLRRRRHRRRRHRRRNGSSRYLVPMQDHESMQCTTACNCVPTRVYWQKVLTVTIITHRQAPRTSRM